jgi:hypothetical protein
MIGFILAVGAVAICARFAEAYCKWKKVMRDVEEEGGTR